MDGGLARKVTTSSCSYTYKLFSPREIKIKEDETERGARLLFNSKELWTQAKSFSGKNVELGHFKSII